MTVKSRVLSSRGSSKDVILFAILTEESYNSLKNALIFELGLPIVMIFLTGGILTPAVAVSILPIVISVLQSMTSVDYYRTNASSDLTTENLNAGSYKFFIISIGSSGTLNAKVTYDYKVMETQTRYRAVTKLITLWAYITESF